MSYMVGKTWCFSGKDSRRRYVVEPFSLSEHLVIGGEHRGSRPTAFDYRKTMASAAQLRLAYELGFAATIRKKLNPDYKLTTDEEGGFRIYNAIRNGEFFGEYLQFVEIKGQPSNGYLPVEIINHPDELTQTPEGIWVAEGGERIRAEIPFIERDGKPRVVKPIREKGELVYYRHGFPVAVTEDREELLKTVPEYAEQITDMKLPDEIRSEIDLTEVATLDLIHNKSGQVELGVKSVFRVFDYFYHNLPYAMVIGLPPDSKQASIGIRISRGISPYISPD